jgi:GNAT superfamily N-acetyltransferase
MTTPPPTLPALCAGWADLQVLSQVIARAFHPLAPSQWLIPDPDARRALFGDYFRLYVRQALTAGVVYTTPERSAAALWLYADDPAGRQPADYDEHLAAATGVWVQRFRTFDTLLAQHHPTGQAHVHLAILAVHPDRQHRGIGTALLAAHHRLLDRADVSLPAYLEASDTRTRELYLRHGYRDHATPIQLPDGPLMYPMWRQPPPRTTEPSTPGGR